MTDHATFTLREERNALVVDIHGELDISNHEQFRSFLRSGAGTSTAPMIVNLDGVGYLDSHAIAALAELSKRLSTNRRRLFIVARKEGPIGRILNTSNLGLAIPMCESLEDALLRTRGV
ncbi:MAG: STAS domain-containing protein [Candidatus Eremiobacteraeota bacterium]|nr:STAS domain-containing protein [Candidatus Eremiobacteraeota bacterium]MBV8366201.1 STAS domain-containing protein [Candidatus Eremiobacteraeota bacterium]